MIIESPNVRTTPDAPFEDRSIMVSNADEIFSLGISVHDPPVRYDVTDFSMSK